MPTHPLIARHLDQRKVPYRVRHHRPAYSAQAVAEREHVSGVRFGKVVVAVADGRPVLFVMPAYDHLDEVLARDALGARELHLAGELEAARFLPGIEIGTAPPLRLWPGVDLWMEKTMEHEGPIVFQGGTHADAIEMDFADWRRVADPQVARVVRPTFVGA